MQSGWMCIWSIGHNTLESLRERYSAPTSPEHAARAYEGRGRLQDKANNRHINLELQTSIML